MILDIVPGRCCPLSSSSHFAVFVQVAIVLGKLFRQVIVIVATSTTWTSTIITLVFVTPFPLVPFLTSLINISNSIDSTAIDISLPIILFATKAFAFVIAAKIATNKTSIGWFWLMESMFYLQICKLSLYVVDIASNMGLPFSLS